MKETILKKAKEDIPLYFTDFKTFWDSSISNINDESLTQIYEGTLILKNYKISLHQIKLVQYDLIIDEIFEDINSSFFLALMGLYRSAHMHLRSSIELSLQLLYFIHHPIEFGQWKKGDFVLKHEKITGYLRNHPNFESFNISQLIDLISINWKTFSKHIHGESPIFFQCETDLRKTNTFSQKDFNIWKGNYLRNIYQINKLYLLFFKEDLHRFPSKSYDLLTNKLNTADKELIIQR